MRESYSHSPTPAAAGELLFFTLSRFAGELLSFALSRFAGEGRGEGLLVKASRRAVPHPSLRADLSHWERLLNVSRN